MVVMDAICGVGDLINSIDGEASAASLGNMGHWMYYRKQLARESWNK